MSNNLVQTLREYVMAVMDRNRDGKIDLKEIVGLFPNHAVMVAVIFVDLLVAVAEYRVWDVGYILTGDVYKAVGFVLVSAIPFYLGQLFWLYPLANGLQKWISGAMVATALYTSWVFSMADLTKVYDVTKIYGIVANLTAAYVVSTLVYILWDDTIKAHRIKKQAEGAAKRERDFQRMTREILRDLAETQKLQNETVKEFGDAELVQAQLERLRGTKAPKPTAPQYQFASTARRVELDDDPKVEGRRE